MTNSNPSAEPKLRIAMVGGGEGSFMGPVHRLAMSMTGRYQLVAACFSPNADTNSRTGEQLGIDGSRLYSDVNALAAHESSRMDPVHVATIISPNRFHAEQASTCLRVGIDVICEKPMATSLADALDMVRIANECKRVLAVTHTYTGYPMVRHARLLVAEGRIGAVRTVQVEYPQSWLARPLEETGHKQAAWRVNPEVAGAGCLGDIGSHAFNLAEFITGLEISSVAAQVTTSVAGRAVDDNVNALIRFSNGASGVIWASQIAYGTDNDLKIRVFGSDGSVEWSHTSANYLRLATADDSVRLLSRGAAGAESVPAMGDQLPPGHPEGYFEAFRSIYRDAAENISARMGQRTVADWATLLPSGRDGARAVSFVDDCLASSRSDGSWTAIVCDA
ncbi:MAG: Gfo/Idh/MocA family protein [Hyphomicrobiaceae bacterium]